MPLIIHLLGEKAVYGFENPGYPLTHHLFFNDSRMSVPIPVDNDGVIVSKLEQFFCKCDVCDSLSPISDRSSIVRNQTEPVTVLGIPAG